MPMPWLISSQTTLRPCEVQLCLDKTSGEQRVSVSPRCQPSSLKHIRSVSAAVQMETPCGALKTSPNHKQLLSLPSLPLLSKQLVSLWSIKLPFTNKGAGGDITNLTSCGWMGNQSSSIMGTSSFASAIITVQFDVTCIKN